MIPELYQGLIIGLIIAIAPVVLSHFFISRRVASQQRKEHHEEIISEVYSPLFFVLNEIRDELGFLTGRVTWCLENDVDNPLTQERLLYAVNRFSKEKKLGEEISEILKKRIGLINPKELRLDLFNYSLTFSLFETGIPIGISEVALKKEKKTEIERKMKDIIQIASLFNAVSISLLIVFEKIFRHEKSVDGLKHKQILTREKLEKLRFHVSPNHTTIERKAMDAMSKGFEEIFGKPYNRDT